MTAVGLPHSTVERDWIVLQQSSSKSEEEKGHGEPLIIAASIT
jgi:hypothetical protein